METFGSGPTKEEGLRLIKAGDYRAAVSVLDQVVEADPSDAQAFLYLGVAYAEMGSKAEAIAAFEQSVSVRSTPKGHYNLGLAYESVERLGEAMTQFQNAARLDNTYKAALDAIDRLRKQGIEAKESTVQWTIGARSVGDAMAQQQTQQMTPSSQTTAIPPAFSPQNLQSQPQSQFRPYLPGEYEAQQEAKLHENQVQMTKSGLIYGIIFGPIGLAGMLFFCRFFMPPSVFNIPFVLIGGAVTGAIIGAICGFTGGGEETGERVGALMFGLVCLVSNLLNYAGPGFLAFQTFIGVAMGWLIGMFVGRMVDASIGWN